MERVDERSVFPGLVVHALLLSVTCAGACLSSVIPQFLTLLLRQDLSVQDNTGVPHLPGSDLSQWNGTTPTATLCATFSAWENLLQAAKSIGDACRWRRRPILRLLFNSRTSSSGVSNVMVVCCFVCLERNREIAEPFRYDLVNLGRELLAQLSTPWSLDFFGAFTAATLNSNTLTTTGDAYISLLRDIDALVATDSAFLLGPWLEVGMAPAARVL